MSNRILEAKYDRLPIMTEALVVSNNDPKVQERILVRIPGIHNMEIEVEGNAIWSNHCAPVAYSSGGLPKQGDWVYVMFPGATDFEFCLWMGSVRFSKQKDVYSEKKQKEQFLEKKILELDPQPMTIDTEWQKENG